MNQSQPLPPGLPPNFAGPPPNFAAAPPMEMVPQPVAPKTDLAVASTVVEGATTVSKIGLAPSAKTSVRNSNTATNDDTKKKRNIILISLYAKLAHIFHFVDQGLSASVSLRMLELTMSEGLSEETPIAFAYYGVSLARNGNINEGCRLGGFIILSIL